MNRAFQIFVLAAVVSAGMIGCATTQQADSVVTSGFLSNYSQLKAGEGDQALRRYVKPGVRWSSYNKILLQPVRVYAAKGSDLANASPEERSALANYFTSALREELAKNNQLVTSAGPGVLTIRTAITEGDESEVLLDTVTTLMPIGLAVSTLKRVVTGADSFVGQAGAEMEILDSYTGERLAAAVDRRFGTKALRSKFGGWNHAKEAFDYWAQQLSERLEEAKKGGKI